MTGDISKSAKGEKYQLLPELPPEQFKALKQDIAEHGVQVPVIVDEFGAILEGHNRVRACRELGINDYPIEVKSGLSETEKRALARKLNALRRHLTREQVRDLIGDQLRDTPEWADRRIGRELGVDHKTVGAVRADLGATGEIPQLEKTVGDDGKARPRQQPDKRGRRRKLRPADVIDDDDFWRDDDDDRPRPDSWNNPVKKAKLDHAIDLIKLGVDPNSEQVVKLIRDGSSFVINSPPGSYRVFAHCTEAGEREWYLFILFLSKEWNWYPDNAAAHVEYLSQKQFMDPDEWLGEEGRRFRARSFQRMREPSDEFKQAWAAFKQTNNARSQAEINAEIEAIYKEHGPAPITKPKRKRKIARRAA